MKYKIFAFLLGAFLMTACSDDDLSSTSIFDEPAKERTEFDQWLKKNYTDPYNIDFMYRYHDYETNNYYNVIPADLEKSKALAIMLKHIWIGAYNEVMGEDFLKTYSPRVMQLIGSCQYNGQGSKVLGTAEGGLKITLFNVNNIDLDNLLIDQDSPFPNTGSDVMDLNYWYFHTMHHEFNHILAQKKSYSTDFQTVSAGEYRTSDWINLKDEDAPALGFVSGYASKEYNEDFAEIYSTYITHTPEAWEKLLMSGVKEKKDDAGNIIYAVDKSGNPVYKHDNQGNPVYAVDEDHFLIPRKDPNGDVIYAKNRQGEFVYVLDGEGNPIPMTDGQTNVVYYFDDEGQLQVDYVANGQLVHVTQPSGNPVYEKDESGATVYDRSGQPVPAYYRIPLFEYERMPQYDTSGPDKIVKKLNIMRDYFRDSWNMDLDQLRDAVLRRSKDVTTLDLKNLK